MNERTFQPVILNRELITPDAQVVADLITASIATVGKYMPIGPDHVKFTRPDMVAINVVGAKDITPLRKFRPRSQLAEMSAQGIASAIFERLPSSARRPLHLRSQYNRLKANEQPVFGTRLEESVVLQIERGLGSTTLRHLAGMKPSQSTPPGAILAWVRFEDGCPESLEAELTTLFNDMLPVNTEFVFDAVQPRDLAATGPYYLTW